MQRFAAALVFSMTGASAGKAKVSVQTGASGLPLGLNPVVDKDWDLFAGKVTLGGTYDLADSAFAPKALHVTAKRPGLKAKLSLSDPVSKAPKALVTATVGDLKDGDYAALTVDSKAPTPKLLELMPVTVPATSVVLSPSWEPRTEGVEGLRLDVDAPLNGNRANVAATLKPKTRPKLKFHFDLDGSTSLGITPLLGSDGASTKWEVEKKGLPHGVAATAALLDKTLTVLAKIPFAGTLVPSVSLPVDLSSKPKFSLKQSFSL